MMKRPPRLPRVLGVLVACVLAPPVLGVSVSTPARAEAVPINRARCLARAEELPDFAFIEAQAWEKNGGGMDARLCQAIAQLMRGESADAAKRLEAVIPALGEQPADVTAGLWAKAGQGWLNAKDTDKADVDYSKAVKLRPDDIELRIDRATERSVGQRYWDAISDLDHVLALDPKRADALVMRAEARRKLSRDTEAAQDLVAALAVQPDNTQALLSLGNVRAAEGQDTQARVLWTKVRQLAGDAPMGQAAAANLAILNTKGSAGLKTPDGSELLPPEKPLFGH